MEALTLKNSYRRILRFLPEVILIAVNVYWLVNLIYFSFINGWNVVNVVFSIVLVAVIAVMIGQFFWRNIYLSLYFSLIYGFIAIYMLLAVFSEYVKFPAGDPEGVRMLLIGSLLFGGIGLAAFIMPWKYRKAC